MRSTPSAGASAATRRARRSASPRMRSRSPNTARSSAIATPLRYGASNAPPAARAAAMIGLPTVRLQRHTIMKERPEPFGPPSGSSVASFLGSVESRPCPSTPQARGVVGPATGPLLHFPMAAFHVDHAKNSGGRFLAGKAIASGLLETPETLAP